MQIFFTTAKDTSSLLSYSTFLHCSYPLFKTWALFLHRHTQGNVDTVLVVLIKTIMEGKDKITVWSATDFPCNADTSTTCHSPVVLCLPVPCLGNRAHYGKQQIHFSGDWMFWFPQTSNDFALTPTIVAIFGDGVSKKVMTFKWGQDSRLLVQLDYWAYRKT